jgi:phage terminase small subunit|tara:strand:+ start:341 stop:793 length:453 start_codon:yes stop_codon:yes gene_type:complete
MTRLKDNEFTDRQTEFINNLVRLGNNPTQSARLAGYADPKQSAFNLVNSAKMCARIQQERLKLFQSDLSIVAVQTLKEIMQDQQAPASARVSACRSVLEIAGDFKAGQGTSDKSLSDMSPAELASVIDKLDVERIRLAKDVTPAVQDSDK